VVRRPSSETWGSMHSIREDRPDDAVLAAVGIDADDGSVGAEQSDFPSTCRGSPSSPNDGKFRFLDHRLRLVGVGPTVLSSAATWPPTEPLFDFFFSPGPMPQERTVETP